MKNKKFILHKALLDAYYTLFLKRQKLDKYLEELDINIDLEKCRKYYEDYKTECKSLEEAFLKLKSVEKAYKEGVKKRKIKGSKEDKKHGLFQIYFCEYAIIEEGIISICEELCVPYSKVKDKLYRFTQIYHSLSAHGLAKLENVEIPIFDFMKGVLRQKWFHDAFSLNARDILETVIKNNSNNIIDKEYVIDKTIW